MSGTVRGAYAEIDARHLGKSFHRRGSGKAAVNDISMKVTSASAIGIVGESGSGKSTLVRMMCGLLEPTDGTVAYNGAALPGVLSTRGGRREFRSRIQYVAQDTTSSFDPRRTLRDAVRLPAQRLLGMDTETANVRVDETLASLELDPSMADRYPAEVSGGQRQRFSIARALVVKPRILLCDEVVSALDVSVQGAILNMLKSYCAAEDCGLVFVSHGLPATAFIADDIVVMRSGVIVEQGTTDDVVERPQDPYTEQLLEAYRGLDEVEQLAVAAAR
ncbi:MAG: ATP-binding cassette domain-containing protein [Rhodococcus fascians]|uniref:ABC transporter ATP-binding protein n=1 Tax=Nocardiaceae TaxID=85025 RepID=UPI000363C972|nr:MULTISPECIES: ATP-binding cassette domain-containing protein [Rhodococcus]OZD08726.1 peptide ABC transporter ATP-binding protein [Rhodococcus sp. 06-156-4C]OZD17304.1 peptide ABC transporter ATP-binding protein [Rhodococcus sp. 06-156-3C]OZD18641.1 peptide ABC transporter ATP-binding protein [Rhodococcus sp. 06-156-4a]OZD25048.1 peptide ABC transporter ATP-binding protein [Rhodococcus sp. 06-156-3b]OZD34206.1 peptide ABC transporter ATP-binding protein [Rhodococcus sp. 06-156-3]